MNDSLISGSFCVFLFLGRCPFVELALAIPRDAPPAYSLSNLGFALIFLAVPTAHMGPFSEIIEHIIIILNNNKQHTDKIQQ